MELRGRVAAGEIVVACSESLAPLGQSLLATLVARDRAGPALHDGSRVQFGWSTLTLRGDGGVLRVAEPDFRGDPFSALSDGVDRSLSVIRDQTVVLRRTGLHGVDARWDQHVIVVPAAVLQAPNLFLRRETPSGAEDSGWLIGDADDPPGEDAQADTVRVYRLLALRPVLLHLLALPGGSFARVSGDRIEEITDVDGGTRW